MKYTQADLYLWAFQITEAKKTPSFMADVRNKPESRFAADFSKQVIEFAEDPANLEALVAEGSRQLKTIKNGGKEAAPFSLTGF